MVKNSGLASKISGYNIFFNNSDQLKIKQIIHLEQLMLNKHNI